MPAMAALHYHWRKLEPEHVKEYNLQGHGWQEPAWTSRNNSYIFKTNSYIFKKKMTKKR